MVNYLSKIAAKLGKLGGQSKSAAKKKASQNNGRRGGRVAEHRIHKVIQNTNLAALLEHLQCAPSGKFYCCPACNKHKLSISDAHKTWHCFACGNGGSSIRLVMLTLGFGFKQSIEYLETHFHDKS